MSDARIPLAVPNVGEFEGKKLAECIETGWVSTAGQFVIQFEQDIAAFVGSRYAVSTMNGTSALHLALIAAGVQRDTEVVMPALTFIAPANSIRYVGAWPAFVDVDPTHWQMSVEALSRFFEDQCDTTGPHPINRRTGRRVAAILPVDILGHPCDLGAIRSLADQHGLAIVEDATESLGARWNQKRLGSVSSITCFSFNGNKLITTGGGGMICTDDGAVAEMTRHLSTQAKTDPADYVHDQVGFNYRLTNIQAAIGVAQLERIDSFLKRKRDIADFYMHHLGDRVQFQVEASWAEHAWWLPTVLLPTGSDPRIVVASLQESNIEARRIWEPLHRSAAMKGSWSDGCPVADEIRARAVSLPASTSISDNELHKVAQAFLDALG